MQRRLTSPPAPLLQGEGSQISGLTSPPAPLLQGEGSLTPPFPFDEGEGGLEGLGELEGGVAELEKKLLIFYGYLAHYYRQQLIGNAKTTTFVLRVEEANLLHYLRIGEKQQDWSNSQEEENFYSAIAYFQKAFSAKNIAEDWHTSSIILNSWAQILEAQKNWIEATEKYINVLASGIEYNQEWIYYLIRHLGRMLNKLGESQFETVWREVTGEDLEGELREAIWTARDNLKTEE